MHKLTPAFTFLFLLGYASARAPAAEARHEPLDPSHSADWRHFDAYCAALSDEQQGHYAAIKLAELGPRTLPEVIAALASPDPVRRKWSARVLTNMGAEKAGLASGPLVVALSIEQDESALWSMVQAVGVLKPRAPDPLPALLKVFGHPSTEAWRPRRSANWAPERRRQSRP